MLHLQAPQRSSAGSGISITQGIPSLAVFFSGCTAHGRVSTGAFSAGSIPLEALEI